MTRFVSCALALIAAGWSAGAQAADLNYGGRTPYTVNQPLNAYSWAGPYLGGNVGWTAGVGAEFGFAPNWSAKIEYLYVDLARSNFVITGASHGLSFGTLRAGVNYHF